MIFLNRYSGVWAIRFHAFHSILMTASWAFVWGTLRLVEHISPWLLGVLARELRYVANVGFFLVWLALLMSTYEGTRCAIIPPIHLLAVRCARRFERYVAPRARAVPG
jgi:uncharacterized membrane protein